MDFEGCLSVCFDRIVRWVGVIDGTGTKHMKSICSFTDGRGVGWCLQGLCVCLSSSILGKATWPLFEFWHKQKSALYTPNLWMVPACGCVCVRRVSFSNVWSPWLLDFIFVVAAAAAVGLHLATLWQRQLQPHSAHAMWVWLWQKVWMRVRVFVERWLTCRAMYRAIRL